MTRYSREPENPSKSVKARGSYLRVHFKNTREVGHAIKNMPLRRAVKYLKNVMEHKEIVPFKRFNGGVGRKAQVNLKFKILIRSKILTYKTNCAFFLCQDQTMGCLSRQMARKGSWFRITIIKKCREQRWVERPRRWPFSNWTCSSKSSSKN